MSSAELIPNRLHFVWFGPRLPCFAALAVRSAALRNHGAKVVLWHDQTLAECPRALSLGELGVEFRRLEFRALIESAQALAPDQRLRQALDVVRTIFGTLQAPAARSNLTRLLVLYTEGGIYLDTDTLTLKDLGELRKTPAFCGLEHLLWSKRRLNFRRPYLWTLGPALTGFRLLHAWSPRGYSAHRRQLAWYDQAANNAVLGFTVGHPLLSRAFIELSRLPKHEWTVRYRLGTHLLQELLESQAGSDAKVHQYPPDYFYPLGPVISGHYFHERRDAAATAAELIPTSAHVLHWYASVADLSGLDEAHIREHRERTVYAHLCAPFLP